MLLKSSLCLTAVLSVLQPVQAAADIPFWAQPAIDSGLALSGLNTLAVLKSLGNFKGQCNPLKLNIRQEWYVLYAYLGISVS